MTKKFDQNPHCEFPSAEEIIAETQKHSIRPAFLLSIPNSLLPLAEEIVGHQQQLNQLRDDYNLIRLTERAKVYDLSRQEEALLRRLKKEEKIKKEREKIGKSLRGWEKKAFKKTGKLLPEMQSEMMAQFKAFLESQNGVPNV